MEDNLDLNGRHYVIVRCSRPLRLPHPFVDQPYVCMLWDAGIQASEEERRSVAEALIDSRCRYVVCGGTDCESWHDAVDRAYVAREFSQAEKPDRFIMTTWHTGQPLEEVVWFAVHNAEYEGVGFNHFLVLALSVDNEMFRELVELVRRQGAMWHAGADSVGDEL